MNIIISNSSDEPIYSQIVRQIKELILLGELSAQSLLPSIRTLARELQISVITTKRAYEELEREGFIETFPGKGSFVAGGMGEFIRETQFRIIEEKLDEAVSAAKAIGLSRKELEEMIKILFEEK